MRVARPTKPSVPPPPDRGRLLTDADVACLLRLDAPESVNVRRWVREHVPHKKRIGHNTVRWFERDVLDWVDSSDAA